jgi:flagellar motility protein MotE (MotC chaperone)
VTPAGSRQDALAAPRPRRRGGFTALLLVLAALAVVRLSLPAGALLEPQVDPAPQVPQVTDLTLPALPEPAAGPENAAAAPQTTTGPPAEAPPSKPPALDPARLTASEIAVLHELAARREALDRRARALDERGLLIETAAADLEGQLARLGELHNQIAAMVEAHDAAEEAKLASLVKIYETMKPKAAAEIFDRLEMAVLIRVVERMREAKSADVLARMDPLKAKQVTTELARRTELLEAARGSGS